MEAALRSGEPILLDLSAPPPPEVRLDDIVPLCAAVKAWEPALTRVLQAFLPPHARPGRPWRVTAIIPTHRQTPVGLDALRGQDLEVEVLVLANGPAGVGPRARVPVEGDRVVSVPWEGHGRTRQRGVELARTDHVLFTVDDALPLGAGFVRTLVEALEEGGFDAVFARQVPWPTASEVTCRQLRAWTPPGHHAREVARLDHVAALYRRSTLLACPLPDAPIAEDLHWARGHRIGYVPFAPVAHSHPRRPLELFRRTRATHRERIGLGESPQVPSIAHLVGALPGLAGPVLEGGAVEILNQGAELLGQWFAARDRRAP